MAKVNKFSNSSDRNWLSFASLRPIRTGGNIRGTDILVRTQSADDPAGKLDGKSSPVVTEGEQKHCPGGTFSGDVKILFA